MATTNDVLHANRTDRAAWSFDPDQVQVERPSQPTKSAVQHVARMREGEKAHAKDRDEVLERLQAKRKRQRAERAKTAGLSTADILAARRLGTG
jgi:hypothetical protein